MDALSALHFPSRQLHINLDETQWTTLLPVHVFPST